MNRTIVIGIIVFAFLQINAQNWRPNEMQISIPVTTEFDYESFADLKLQSDFSGPEFNHISAYVTPKEILQLENLGIHYSIEVQDLNLLSQQHINSKETYHSYQEILDLADSLQTHFPDICKKYIFGYSVEGRECAALKISDNVETDENEAEIMFDGGIHGDEIGGAENIIRFARDICIEYNDDPQITELINNREIWLYLMVNPDGRFHDVRTNSNGVDLNRDWGFMWDAWGGSPSAFSQPESKALRACSFNNQFVVHTSYHSGTEFISLPWSYRPDQPHDWDFIYNLAEIYSTSSGYANLEFGQGYNGMYAINGSTKDSNYGIMGSVTWSLEISFDKHPPSSQIMLYYNYNKPGMIAMIENGGYGIDGLVSDANTGDPVTAVVFVDDSYPTYTDPNVGDYHKYLTPGTYEITIIANGYETQTIENVSVVSGQSTTTNFELQPADGQFVYKFCASQIANNNHADEGWTPAVIGAPDNINYSLGKSGWCVLDMQYPIEDGPGNDFIVYEGDSSPESYSVYVSDTIDGPWHEVGEGTSTASFDLSASGMYEARYIKILDDGDGSSSGNDIGFDLDAIEVLPPEPGIYITMINYEIDDSNGNNNGKIDPGETIDLNITIKNNGDATAQNVLSELESLSPYFTIINQNFNYGDLGIDETAIGTYTFEVSNDTPPGSEGTLKLNISANNGSYTNNFEMNFIIGQIPIAIFDIDPNHSSGPVMQAAIEANDFSAEYLTEIPDELNLYSTIFVCLGIYSNNIALGSVQGQALADFLNDGGNLYMEGGDTWAFDTQTAVHEMFNIDGTEDGSSDLGTIMGQSGTFTEGMSFNYSGENNWIDHLEPIAPAFSILENQSPSYKTAIAYDEGSYKTIGASHEFGGLTDGSSPSTKEELMAEYLDFFGVTGSNTIFANFTANETEICVDNDVHFTDLSVGEITEWNWEFEGGTPSTSSDQNPSVIYYDSGEFDVSLTVSDGVNSHSLLMTDYILVLANPEIPEQPSGDINVCVNYDYDTDYTIPLVANATGYTWNLYPTDAGIISTNVNTATINWNNSFEGIAEIKVASINECGESSFSEVLEVTCDLCQSIEEFNILKWSISPNPNNGTFKINFNKNIDRILQIKISNTMGETLENIQTNYFENYIEVNLSDVRKGAYLIQIIDESDGITSQTIIVQ